MQSPSQFDVVVVGGANYDYLARAPQFPGPGDTVQGDLIADGPGGKGANQAVAAARLGAKVAFVGRIGKDDRGERIVSAFEKEGVNTQFVVRDSKAPTGVALIHVNASGEKQILAVGGANQQLSNEDIHAAREFIAQAKVLLLQLEVPVETTRVAARLAHDAGVAVLLDPAPAVPLDDELLRWVKVIKPNAGEAQVITGVKVTDQDSARTAARQLLDRGVHAAAVTAGSEGNLIVSRDGESWLPRVSVKSVDATGAGDAFAAGLGVMLAEGRPLGEAGAFANAMAALTTTVIGAQDSFPSREAVLKLLQR